MEVVDNNTQSYVNAKVEADGRLSLKKVVTASLAVARTAKLARASEDEGEKVHGAEGDGE